MKHYNKLFFLILFCFLNIPLALAETEALWAKSAIKGPGNSRFYSVALDNDSSLCVAGSIRRNEVYTFDNRITLGSDYEGTNVAILKYDGSGNAQWARSAVIAPNHSFLRKSATDTSDNEYYGVGQIDGTEIFDFGNTIRTQGNSTLENAFLIKYDKDGKTKWTKVPTVAPGASSFHSVITDNNGTIYTSGFIDGSGVYDFGNGATVNGSSSTTNCVLAKYESSGNTIWARSILSGQKFSNFNNIAIDDAKNVYVAGYVSGTDTYDFGNGVAISGSSLGMNLILLKYDSSGNPQWAKSVMNSSGSSLAIDIALDNVGCIYIAGRLTEDTPFDFGNGVHISGSYSGDNVLLIKYDSSGNALWAKSTVSSINDSSFHSIAIDNNGDIFVAGEIYGDKYFDFGNGVTVTGSHTHAFYGNNPILVKYDSNGNAKWAKSTKNSSDEAVFHDVTLDNSGNIYASGWCMGNNNFDFGNGVIVKGDNEGENALLVKYGDVTPTPSSSSSNSSSGAVPTSSSSTPSSEVSSGTKTSTKTLLGIGAAFIAAI